MSNQDKRKAELIFINNIASQVSGPYKFHIERIKDESGDVIEVRAVWKVPTDELDHSKERTLLHEMLALERDRGVWEEADHE